MDTKKEKQFTEKTRSDVKLDSKIKNEVLKRAPNGELPCLVAFQIARELDALPTEVGMTADLLNFKLIKCQLGLFGYKPKKKIVKPEGEVNQDMIVAIREGLVGGQLPCKSAWDIASRFKVPKMTISGACESLNIKIKECQLGAF